MPTVLLVVRWPLGGIRSHIVDLLRAPALEHVGFTLLMPRLPEAVRLAEQVADRGPRLEWCDDSEWSLWRRVREITARATFDLVHSHGFQACAVVGTQVPWRRIRHFTTVHDVFTAAHVRGLKGHARMRGAALGLHRSHLIHCVTRDSARNVLRYAGDALAPKLRVVPHGIDVGRFAAAAPRDFRAELGLTPNKYIVGFFGRFMSQKGFRVLCEALRRLRDSKRLPENLVVIAFDNADGFVREDRAHVDSLGLASCFRFVPYVSFIGPELKGVDVVVMPSLWEASGLLAMEALVAGVPLIASSCEGLRETVAGTPATTVTPGDADELAAALLAAHDRGPRRLSPEDTLESARRFDVAASMRGIRELYEECTSVGLVR